MQQSFSRDGGRPAHPPQSFDRAAVPGRSAFEASPAMPRQESSPDQEMARDIRALEERLCVTMLPLYNLVSVYGRLRMHGRPSSLPDADLNAFGGFVREPSAPKSILDWNKWRIMYLVAGACEGAYLDEKGRWKAWYNLAEQLRVVGERIQQDAEFDQQTGGHHQAEYAHLMKSFEDLRRAAV